MNKSYLFATHPEEELVRWAKTLRGFRFFRAFGGHANDGDSLDVALRYDSRESLLKLAQHLGVTLCILDPNEVKAVAGKNHASGEIKKFKSAIPEHPDLEQPGHQTIQGIKVFIWCQSGQMNMSIVNHGDNGYSVTEADFNAAKNLEPLLDGISDRIIDPPKPTDHYFTPMYYPEYFKQGGL